MIIKPGSVGDGYWDNDDILKQIKEKIISIFRILHLYCDALFMFENSMNYRAKAPVALHSKRLNLSDGGANVKPMRDGWFVDESGQKSSRKCRTAKASRKKFVLPERELWSFDSEPSKKEAE